MANIRKPTYSRAIPPEAKIITKGGKRFARFKHKDRRIDAPLTKDGKKCRVETDAWYIRYKDSAGEWQETKGYTDRQATEALGVKLERRASQQKEGLADPFETHHARPLVKHLGDFQADLAARGVSPEEVVQIPTRARKVIDSCRFEKIADLSASGVQAFLAELRQAGRSPQTANHYLQSIKQFSRWLVRDRRTNDNPLAHLSKQNVRVDRRHDRRPLADDEFARLIEAAEAGPAVETIPGPDRAMMYILSAWTGFRRKELSSLTVRSFILDAETPVVRVAAAYAKNGRDDEIPLHPGVVERLTTWLVEKDVAAGDSLFPLRTFGDHWRKTSKMMKQDLEAGRSAWIEEADNGRERQRREESDFLTYQNEDGLFADFHANRHTFISNLGRAGVSLVMAQKLARHSTADLTSNTYTHLGLNDRVAAIESLPGPPTSDEKEPHQNELRATGTDDADTLPLPKTFPRASQGSDTTGHGGAQNTTPEGGSTTPGGATQGSPQVVSLQRVGTSRRGQTRVETSGIEPPTPGLQILPVT